MYIFIILKLQYSNGFLVWALSCSCCFHRDFLGPDIGWWPPCWSSRIWRRPPKWSIREIGASVQQCATHICFFLYIIVVIIIINNNNSNYKPLNHHLFKMYQMPCEKTISATCHSWVFSGFQDRPCSHQSQTPIFRAFAASHPPAGNMQDDMLSISHRLNARESITYHNGGQLTTQNPAVWTHLLKASKI